MKRSSLYTKDYFLSSSDDEQSSGSDTDEQKPQSRRPSTSSVKSEDADTDISDVKPKNENILYKLLNREVRLHVLNKNVHIKVNLIVTENRTFCQQF